MIFHLTSKKPVLIIGNGALRQAVEAVIAANPQSVADYKNGKQKAMGFLVGQTMRAMKGKADPGKVNQIVRELLEE